MDRRSVMAWLCISASVLAACRKTPEEALDTREAIAIMYVATPTIDIREAPSASSKILSSYKQGETLSLLAIRGDWAEVRTGSGSGWVQRNDLTRVKGGPATPDNTTVRFKKAPMAVATAARSTGEIVLEAFVNSDGKVVTVTTVENSTGSAELERRNRDELSGALFEPMIVGGQPRTFIYTHRVTY